MAIEFHKYQGAGNDFIMIDNRNEGFSRDPEVIALMCDRRFGIGADGLILIQEYPGYDFNMVYFNADGHEGSMCGNGGRCAVMFAYHLGMITEATRFMAYDGEHTATVEGDIVRLSMRDVGQISSNNQAYFVDTGSPHHVEFVDDVAKVDVVNVGRAVRYHEDYRPTGGTNVNFAEKAGIQRLKVRTYERGVEDETLACGTGVTACALTAAELFAWQGPIEVEVPGGKLAVEFDRTENGFTNIFLIGPAKFVFKGSI